MGTASVSAGRISRCPDEESYLRRVPSRSIPMNTSTKHTTTTCATRVAAEYQTVYFIPLSDGSGESVGEARRYSITTHRYPNRVNIATAVMSNRGYMYVSRSRRSSLARFWKDVCAVAGTRALSADTEKEKIQKMLLSLKEDENRGEVIE